MGDQYGLPPRQQEGWPVQPQPQAPPNLPLSYYPGSHHVPGAPPKRKRRVFLWVFLAIQAIFLIWIIGGAATVHTGPPHAQLVSACYHHNWWPLFKSQADCVTHFGGALQGAGNLGKGLGIAAVIIFWMVVDVILGAGYVVYRLSTRERLGRGDR